MKEIYATTRIRRRDIAEGRYMGSSLRDSTMRDLARGLADQLLKMMELREEVDPETGDLVVRAGVYVAEGGERVRSGNDGSMATFVVPRFAPSSMTEMMIEPPPVMTTEKMMAALDEMKKLSLTPLLGPLMFDSAPLQFMSERILRKKAMLEGDAAAVAKASGEKEVRENTKKRGSTVTIEVGVRKITMPEKKEAGR